MSRSIDPVPRGRPTVVFKKRLMPRGGSWDLARELKSRPLDVVGGVMEAEHEELTYGLHSSPVNCNGGGRRGRGLGHRVTV